MPRTILSTPSSSRARVVRQCSVCHKSGHSKRTCLTARPQARVVVQVRHDSPVSPHVVRLGAPAEASANALPSYRELALSKTDRVTVNFAESVRLANARSVKPVPPPPSVVPMRAPAVVRLQPEPNKEAEARRTFAERWQRLRQKSVSGLRGLRWHQAMAMAVMAALVIWVPFPVIGYYREMKETSAALMNQSAEGFLSLQSSTAAALAADIPKAEEHLTAALHAFAAANDIITQDHKLLVKVAGALPFIGKEVASRQKLLAAGGHLALGNTLLLKGVDAIGQSPDHPTDKLSRLRQHITSAIPEYQAALEDLREIPITVVPVELQQSFVDFKVLFTAAVDDMSKLTRLMSGLQSIMGDETFRRYLVVFQNQHELRPTGGFMGSFAVIDVQKGKIVGVEVPGGGTYDLQGQLSEFVKPPLPLQLVNSRWEFQDANWFPDFPTAAKKMMWFYEHGRGVSVDGVIAINASVLEDVLTVLKTLQPADMPNVILTGGSAVETLESNIRAASVLKSRRPKAVIGQMVTTLLDRLPTLSPFEAVQLLTRMHEAAGRKDVQVYFTDQAVESSFRDFGWTGELTPTAAEEDYLMVVVSNVQGQKTDAKVKQSIRHVAEVHSDGTVTDTVTVRREHAGQAGEALYGGPNISYIRLYVPAGAVLESAKGFQFPPEDAFHVPETWYADDQDLSAAERNESLDVQTGTRTTSEFGKTVFGNWAVTEPGQVTEFQVQYRLPWRVFAVAADKRQPTSPYRLLIEKQSGVEAGLSGAILYPADWMPKWQSEESLTALPHGVSYETTLAEGQSFGVLMEKSGNL